MQTQGSELHLMDGQEGHNLISLVFQGRVSWTTQREISEACEEASRELRAPTISKQ